MKVIAVDYVGSENVFIVYFSAPHRVDFRALVRDLGGRLRARVELQQIGPRDEARLQGGIGPCGRDLCCATFLKDFEPVSVRMAKDQDLPVNPMRIAGACGRLMCCLKYEHPLYQDFRRTRRAIGTKVDHAGGPGHGRWGTTCLRTAWWCRLAADGAGCACPRPACAAPGKAYEEMHASADPRAGACRTLGRPAAACDAGAACCRPSQVLSGRAAKREPGGSRVTRHSVRD